MKFAKIKRFLSSYSSKQNKKALSHRLEVSDETVKEHLKGWVGSQFDIAFNQSLNQLGYAQLGFAMEDCLLKKLSEHWLEFHQLVSDSWERENYIGSPMIKHFYTSIGCKRDDFVMYLITERMEELLLTPYYRKMDDNSLSNDDLLPKDKIIEELRNWKIKAWNNLN